MRLMDWFRRAERRLWARSELEAVEATLPVQLAAMDASIGGLPEGLSIDDVTALYVDRPDAATVGERLGALAVKLARKRKRAGHGRRKGQRK